jgi:hypothetical protein
MLNGNLGISKREHQAFFWLTFAGLAFRLVEVILWFMFAKPRPDGGFAIYDILDMWEMMSPLYSFVVFLICIACALRLTIPSQTFSLMTLALLVFFFDRWFLDTRRVVKLAVEVNPGFEFKTFDFAVANGSIFDFLTLCLVNILFIWQISLLVRLIRSGRA